MLLYIIRHGIPDYETDTLTRDGKEQAEALSNRLFKCGINKIFSSPLGRALETAIPTSKKLGIKIQILQFASEDIYWKTLTTQDSYTQELEWGYKNRINFLGRMDSYKNDNDYRLGFYNDDLAKSSLSFLKKESDAFISSLGYLKNGIGNGYDVVNDNDEKVAIFCHQSFGLHWISYKSLLNKINTFINDYEIESKEYYRITSDTMNDDPYKSHDYPLQYCKYKVSVIIPAWNSDDTLLHTLQSIGYSRICSLFNNMLEVIVVDDGSTDDTYDSINNSDFPFKMIYIKQKHISRSAAINTGVKKASGELFVFCDSDILWVHTLGFS